jgi:Xaa-Pro dipeptidase
MPNSIAVLPRDGEPRYLHADDFVAPTPMWERDGQSLRERYWIDHYTVWPAAIARDIWAKWLSKCLAQMGITKGRVGLDQAPWQWYEEFKKTMPKIEFVDAENEILYARAIKTVDELSLIKKACQVASKAVEAGLKALKPGVTEYEVYRAAMGESFGNGSEGDGFWPFLTSGPVKEGAFYPTNRKIQEGDPVIIDIGPVLNSYNGDCMRTGYVGKPTEEFRNIYKANYDVMYAVVNTARPGAKASDCYEAAAKVCKEHGYPEPRFDFGHGIGLSCCEMPSIVKKKAYDWVGGAGRRDLELKPGMVFSSEPRLFKPIGKGVFIQTAMEEVIAVTDTGHEVLTSASFMEELLD